MDLSKLPSPFYRVTIKAIIRDSGGRLLVGKAKDDTWETPGGGWEHGESFEDCIRREINEELGVKVDRIGQILFTWIGPPQPNPKRSIMLRLATDVTLSDTNFKFGDLKEARFVDKEELLKLPFVPNEAGIKDCAGLIWPD